MGLFGLFRKKSSPIQLITEKLEADLVAAKFSRDWIKRQDVSLKLKWLQIVKSEKDYLKGFLPELRKLADEDDINSLTIEAIRFPKDLDITELLHYPFAEAIIKECSKAIQDGGKYSGCIYKPASLFPYPMDYLIEAMNFQRQSFSEENALFQAPSNKDNIIRLLDMISISLMNFLPLNEDDLPHDRIGNITVATNFKDTH